MRLSPLLSLEFERAVRCVGAALLLSLGSCTWDPIYVPYGPNGGYREYNLAADLYEVRFEVPDYVKEPHFDLMRELTLLRSAEVAQARGDRFLCIESVQQHYDVTSLFPGAYLSYTIQTFAEAPRSREARPAYSYRPLVEFGVPDLPVLYACYDASATQRRLRAKYDITTKEVGSP